MKKILIVDDDSAIRDVLKLVLSGKYQVTEAGSKKEGQMALTRLVPDLIILDGMMENLSSGFDMAREIRKDARFAKTKILMVTNIDNETKIDFKSEAKDNNWLPVDDYVVKPVDPREILDKVQELIGK